MLVIVCRSILLDISALVVADVNAVRWFCCQFYLLICSVIKKMWIVVNAKRRWLQFWLSEISRISTADTINNKIEEKLRNGVIFISTELIVVKIQINCTTRDTTRKIMEIIMLRPLLHYCLLRTSLRSTVEITFSQSGNKHNLYAHWNVYSLHLILPFLSM